MAIHFKSYLSITKPGIIFGNAITAIAGFALASQSQLDVHLLRWMLLGLSLIVGSGCVSNNYLDREMDEKMARTQNRALVSGKILPYQALIFSLVLGLSGSAVLWFYTNFLTLTSALFGLFFYVVVYGLAKYRTWHGTLIGSVSGAIPPLVGYFAVKPDFNVAVFLLFLITAFWQMPHFYAIAIYRLGDYRQACIPVLPVVKGIEATKRHIFAYTLAFVVATLCLPLTDLVGWFFFSVMTLLGLWWIWLAFQGFKRSDGSKWARSVFFSSLIIICMFTLTVVIDASGVFT